VCGLGFDFDCTKGFEGEGPIGLEFGVQSGVYKESDSVIDMPIDDYSDTDEKDSIPMPFDDSDDGLSLSMPSDTDSLSGDSIGSPSSQKSTATGLAMEIDSLSLEEHQDDMKKVWLLALVCCV
jgi:hypothetical protein